MSTARLQQACAAMRADHDHRWHPVADWIDHTIHTGGGHQRALNVADTYLDDPGPLPEATE